MILDSMIKKGKRPLTCFDVEIANQFIGKKGYFAHCIDYYADLKNTVLGTLGSTEDADRESFVCTEEPFDNYYYEFFIPAEWVMKEEDRKRKEREAEIMRIDLELFAYARKQRYTLGDKFYRKFALRNALILDYGKTYGTEAQERLREMLDEAREKLLARMHEFEKEAGTDKMTESEIKQQIYDYRAEIERLNEIIDLKEKQISEYKKILDVQEKRIYMQEQHILNLKFLLNRKD